MPPFKSDSSVILLHSKDQTSIFHQLIKRSEKIKYTCFAVSKNYVIFGATSGGLYVFKKHNTSYSFWHLIPSNEKTINVIAISPSENLVAFSSSKRVLCIVELSEISGNNGKFVTRSEDFDQFDVTALCWTHDQAIPALFVGDSGGNVSQLKLSFLNKNILHLPTICFVTLDSKVVQLCYQNELLLVSTTTRCYLCDTIKEQYKQIGQQLRDGPFGAAFIENKIFCARPGCRLWEVDLEGTIHNTRQFKRQLSSIRRFPFVSIFVEPRFVDVDDDEPYLPWKDVAIQNSSSRNFTKLFHLSNDLVVTFDTETIYILNTSTAGVVFSSDRFGTLIDLQCYGNSIYVWDSRFNLHELVVLSIEKCLLRLYFDNHFTLYVRLIDVFFEELIADEKRLRELKPSLEFAPSDINDESLNYKLRELKIKLKSVADADLKLNSGIYLVKNKYLSRRMLDDTFLQTQGKIVDKKDNLMLVNDDSEYGRKRSNSLPNTVNRDECEADVMSKNIYLRRHDEDDVIDFATLTAVYNSPFVTAASYDILKENFSELGANVRERADMLFKRWRGIGDKLKSSNLPTNSMSLTVENSIKSEALIETNEWNMPNKFEQKEEAIQWKKPCKTIEEKINDSVKQVCDDVVDLCKRLQPENAENVVLILNTILNEYYKLSNTFNFDFHQAFPFRLDHRWMTELRNIFDRCFSKEFLLSWLRHDQFCVPIENIDLTNIYPSFLIETFTVDKLWTDYQLSRVLTVFADLLDISTVLQRIQSLELPCYYMSFCFVLKYFQNYSPRKLQNDGTVEDNNTGNVQWPTPVYLNTMLLMLSVDQTDVFCKMGIKKCIPLEQIAYMMLQMEFLEMTKIQNNTGNANTKYREILLTYVEEHCENSLFDSFRNFNVLRLTTKIFVSCHLTMKPSQCCPSCWFLLPSNSRSNSTIRFGKLARILLTQFWLMLERISANENLSNDDYDLKTLQFLKNVIDDDEDSGRFVRPQLLHRICYTMTENANGHTSCDHSICNEFQKSQLDLNDRFASDQSTTISVHNEQTCENLTDVALISDREEAVTLRSQSIQLAFNIICKFCYRISELWKYLPSLQEHCGVKLLSWPLFIQLTDFDKLKSHFQTMTSHDAKEILKWTARMLNGHCLNCSLDITSKISVDKASIWTDISLCILIRLGASPTLNVLNEYSSVMTLNPSFYRSLILTSTTHFNGDCVESIVSAISSHFNLNYLSQRNLNILRYALKRDVPQSDLKYTKSNVHHWGIGVYTQNSGEGMCCWCSLPLFSESLIRECNSGIIIFSCNHTYHTICLKNKNHTTSCFVCDRFSR